MWCDWLFPLILLFGSAIIGFLIGWLLRNQKIKQINQENEELTRKKNQELNDSKSKITTLEADVASLGKKNMEWTSKYDAATLKTSELEGSVQDQSKRIAELEESLKSLQGELQHVLIERERLQSELGSLSSSKAAVEEKYKVDMLGWTSKYDAATLKTSELEGSVQDQSKRIAELEESLKSLQGELQHVLIERERLQSELGSLSSSKAAVEEKYKVDMLGWTSKYDAATLKTSELEGSVQDQSKRIAELEESLKSLQGELQHVLIERERLQSELGSLSSSKAAAEEKYKVDMLGWTSKYDAATLKTSELEGSVQDQSKRIAELEESLKSLQSESKKVLDEKERLVGELGALKQDKQELSNRINDLDLALANQKEEYRQKQIALEELVFNYNSLQKRSEELEANKLKQQQEYKNQLELLSSKLELETKELVAAKKEIERLLALIKQLEQERQDLENTSSLSKQEATLQRIRQKAKLLDFERIGVATYSDRDDLKIIKGIGPFIEKKLHALGIYTFWQISNLSPEDEEKVNEAIEFFPGRIKRDHWVKQGGELHQEKLDNEKKNT